VGEWATASICHGKGKDITILKELKFPHSLGLLYSAFTYFLGFKVNSGEYKLMGLAPYGVAGCEQVKKYVGIIKTHLVDVKEDGSIWLNQQYFDYATGLRMVHEDKWEKLFGFKTRRPEAELEAHHCNLGLAIQEVTEEAVIKMAREAKRLTGASNLCMAGGVALNCVANGKVYNTKLFNDVFIQPAAGDAGGALGSALAAYHIYFEKERAKPTVLVPNTQTWTFSSPPKDITPSTYSFKNPRNCAHMSRSCCLKVTLWVGCRGVWNSGRAHWEEEVF
jgi:carbamoyltransferase